MKINLALVLCAISDKTLWLTLLEGFLIFYYLKIGQAELYGHMQNINYKVHATALVSLRSILSLNELGTLCFRDLHNKRTSGGSEESGL